MKRATLISLVVVCAVQLAVPAWMIARREATLRHGDTYRFRTQPVDPYDAFRGRYVALDFEASTYSNAAASVVFDRRQRVYAEITEGPDGYARVTALHEGKIDGACMPVRIRYRNGDNYRLQLPMDRFYLEESRAPEAERLYRQHSRQGASNTYALVRIRNGFPVLTDLVIDGRSVYEPFPAENAQK